MFDDDDGVAHVAQGSERLNQAIIVALMKTDCRFIQYIESSYEFRPKLAAQGEYAGLHHRRAYLLFD
jgi:hypothetical protein